MATAAEKYPVRTAMISTDLHPGWQSCMNIKTEFGPISESAKIVRSWNGTALNLASNDFRLYRVVLTCDGDMLSPSIAHLWPGERFQLVPAEEWSEPTIRAQQRTAYEGSLRILDKHFQPAADGRRYYRPVLDLIVTEPWRVTGDESSKNVSWSLVAEEYGG